MDFHEAPVSEPNINNEKPPNMGNRISTGKVLHLAEILNEELNILLGAQVKADKSHAEEHY